MSILLKVDENGIALAVQRIKVSADKVNTFITKAGVVLGRELSADEKKVIFNEGINFVMGELRKRFPHKDADDDINLRLIGVDVSELQILNINLTSWSQYPQELDENGLFQVVDIMELPEIKSKYTYTTNKEQERVYKLASDFAKMLNKLSKEGFLKNHALHTLNDIAPLVEISNADGVREFRPNVRRISLNLFKVNDQIR